MCFSISCLYNHNTYICVIIMYWNLGMIWQGVCWLWKARGHASMEVGIMIEGFTDWRHFKTEHREQLITTNVFLGELCWTSPFTVHISTLDTLRECWGDVPWWEIYASWILSRRVHAKFLCGLRTSAIC